MNGHDWLAAFIGVVTIVAVRVTDWVLPKKHHWKNVERYGVKETDDE